MKRWQRLIGFLIYYSLRFWSRLPFIWPTRCFMWRTASLCLPGPIWLVDLSDSEGAAAHIEIIVSALRLIQEKDRRRYHRVRSEIRFIVLNRRVRYALYNRLLRACNLNLSILQTCYGTDGPNIDIDREWFVAVCACAIVHEATHGRLFSLWFPYSRRTKRRIERICVAEERRFASRLSSATYGPGAGLVEPFDYSRWEAHAANGRWGWGGRTRF